MVSPVAYAHEPNDMVWVITGGGDCPLAVQEGKVIQIRINVLAAMTTIIYDITVGDDVATTPMDVADVFGDTGSPPTTDNGKAAAITEYNTRLV